ncbi:nucleoside ABC transporter ATP-binding protein [Roseiarcus fermentans]|uniref:Nucleoside ABC transporter ATP-binding protein n=1 Tax=Roseiarcus fermentans TaxID=1473586 RepID=A0A366FFG1_9HYPH|nr:ABC transporter ATP-binding protein [Roseiarcus fermentans]RBP12846.1 nucleoside ABC transporter ATP-binding protein [Roseiarcus fermentans]
MTPALALDAIDKSFDGFRALDQARFVANAGEIHALLGENGAGKSTLMNVACGLYTPDSGTMRLFGAPTRLSGPRDAAAHGIGMVHQHFKLVRPFSILENVLLSRPPAAGDGAPYSRQARSVAQAIAAKAELLGAKVDPRARVDSLSIAEQQRVEVIKALVAGARILILDEPTAVLTDQEAERLLQTLRRLARDGATIVLVTHKLADVKRFADTVTIMRGGKTVAELDPSQASIEELTRLTVGDALPALPNEQPHFGRRRLEALDLTVRRADGAPAVDRVSFFVRAGEIYGLAGVSGNGQSELAELLMGVRTPDSGLIQFEDSGEAFSAPRPAALRSDGAAFIPADRYRFALAGALSVTDNFAIAGLRRGRYGGWAWTNIGRMRAETKEAIRAFDVQGVRSLAQKAALLSGGNAQKLVIAREFSDAPGVVVAQSPSRGLDARATAAVHARLKAAADRGAAVLLVSDDLDEVLKLSNRVGVMASGRLAAEFEQPFDRQEVGRAMVTHG